MEDLRQEFLNESVSNLRTLQKDLENRAEDFFSEELLHALFRRLHTIKGTAQTFDFKISGNLAHEIENLLQALRDGKVQQDGEIRAALENGVQTLLETLQNEQLQKENVYPKELVENLRRLNPDSKIRHSPAEIAEEISQSLLTQLSLREKDSLLSAIHNGRNFFLIEVGFDFADFDEKFKAFRAALSQHGEIVAAAANPNINLAEQIGFQIFFVGRIENAEITDLIKPFKAVLAFESKTSHPGHANNLQGVLTQIVENAEHTSQSLGKQVEFQIVSDEIPLVPKSLKTIYEILLHLTRNAVDHAIELPEERILARKPARGKIQITVDNSENTLVLKIEDDGRGIDIEEIIEKARQKNLIPPDQDLTEPEALELIFSYGFSTSATISEISGRGVGLDVVKEVVDNAGGHIKTQTRRGHGTIFEVYLPQ